MKSQDNNAGPSTSWAKIAATLLMSTLLGSGCQWLRPSETVPDPHQQALLRQINQWQAKGKIALRIDGESHSAQFHWSQQEQDYRLHLFGPFGQGSTWLIKEGAEISLESAETGKQRAGSAEELMAINLGWQVPVANLPFWLRGLQAIEPKATAIELDELGFIARLQQQGWQLSYREYEFARGWWLPAKFVATREQMKMVVVVKQWNIRTKPSR